MQPQTREAGRWAIVVTAAKALPGVMLLILIAATQVGPADAKKRLTDWADVVGVTWPAWLSAGAVLTVTVLLVAGFYAILYRQVLVQLPQRLQAGYRSFAAAPTPLDTPAPTPPALTVQEVVAMESIRVFFRNDAGAPANAIHEILSDLRRNHLKGVTFAPLLDGQLTQLRESMRTLETDVADDGSAPLHVMQRHLVAFLRAYHSVVTSAHECEKERIALMEPPFADAYRSWESGHGGLLGGMETLTAQAGMANIRGAIGEIGLAPVENHRYAVLQSRALKLLESATAAQWAFLHLFCVLESPMRAGERDTLLRHEAYQAGEELVRKRFLLKTKTAQSVFIYSLPDAVYHGWQVYGKSPYPKRREVEIDLSLVQGNGAAGSGAGPSR